MTEFWITYYKYIPIGILLGILIDVVLGDPRFLVHPVQVIGKVIEGLEKVLRKKDESGKRRDGESGEKEKNCGKKNLKHLSEMHLC